VTLTGGSAMLQMLMSTVAASVAAIGLVPVRPAHAQVVAAATYERGPRFLLATATKVVPMDASKTPVLARRLSLELEGATLKQALAEIIDQSGLRLAYSDDVVPLQRRVHLRAEAITAAAALTDVLFDAGVDVVFKPDGSAALVRRAPAVPVQEGVIAGRVTEKAGKVPLVGATVLVEGTRYGATSGNDGRYRIASVPAGAYTVRVRYIGYAPGTASVTVSADQEAAADFALEKSAQRLEEVVTTGTIVETEVKALPSPITVITAEEIREKGITRVDQLFRGEVPGVVAPDQGSSDDITRIFARGGSDLFGLGAIKTYVDGVETSSSFLSTIDPNSIERIELIRGPQASTLYGSEALNGVLQIFTKHGAASRNPVVEGRVAGGAIQTQWVSDKAAPTYRGNLSVSGGTDAFSYRVGGGRLYKGEWLPEYRDAEDNLNGSLRSVQGWFTAELSGRLQYQHRGSPSLPVFKTYVDVVPSFGVPAATDLNYQSTGLALTLRAQATPHWQHTLTLGTDRLLQEFVQRAPHLVTPDDTLLETFSADGQELTFQYTTTLQGPLARSLAGSLTAGVNVSSSKGITLEAFAPTTNGSLGTEAIFLFRTVIQNRGYFAQGQLAIADALFLTAGVRAEDNPNYGQNYGLAWAPRVGVSYVRPLGGVTFKARASYGKSIRAPFTDARDGSVNAQFIYLPNPNIGPESQRGVDAGVELYAGGWGTLQATYYDQTAGDLIDQVLITPGVVSTYQFQNIGEIKNRGVELQGSLSPWRWLTLSGNFAVTTSKVQRLSPAYTGDLQVGDQLLSVPKHTGGANLRLAGGGWTANLGMVAFGSYTGLDIVKDFDCFFRGTGCGASGRDRWSRYPGFAKFRAAVSRSLDPELTAFLNAENLGNSYALEGSNYNVSAGRTTSLGLEFRF
jgi:outer membrane receptor protein involved in Fe transport